MLHRFGTLNFNFPHVADAQASKVDRINAWLNQFDGFAGSKKSYTVSTENAATVSSEDFYSHGIFEINPDGGTPPSGTVIVTVPSTQRGLYVVRNETAQSVAVKTSSQAPVGLATYIDAGDTKHFYNYGTLVRTLYQKGAGASTRVSWENLEIEEWSSGAANKDFALSTGYIAYMLCGWCIMNTDGAHVSLQISDDNASTFETTSYAWNQRNIRNAGTTFSGGSNSDSEIRIFPSGRGGYPVSFECLIIGAEDTESYTYTTSLSTGIHNHASLYNKICYAGGHWAMTTAVTDVRLEVNSGTMTKGRVMLMGLPDTV